MGYLIIALLAAALFATEKFSEKAGDENGEQQVRSDGHVDNADGAGHKPRVVHKRHNRASGVKRDGKGHFVKESGTPKSTPEPSAPAEPSAAPESNGAS